MFNFKKKEAELLDPDEYHNGGDRDNFEIADTRNEQERMANNEYFSTAPNDLRVIQEYNSDENIPKDIKQKKYGWLTKSNKLAFWNDDDEELVFAMMNSMKLTELMAQPKHKYTFEDYYHAQQIDFISFCDFKRAVGMEKHKINERVLQSSMINQQINATPSQAKPGGGVFGWLNNAFS